MEFTQNGVLGKFFDLLLRLDMLFAMETAFNRRQITVRGKRLEYFTIVWNSLEGLVGVVAGALAGSISLIGFGIDSFIEVISGSVLLWRMFNGPMLLHTRPIVVAAIVLASIARH
jgi:hypothetical protein